MGSVKLAADRDGFPVYDGSYVQIFRDNGEHLAEGEVGEHLTYGWVLGLHQLGDALEVQDKEGRKRVVRPRQCVVRKPSVRAVNQKKLVDAQLSAATARLKRRRLS